MQLGPIKFKPIIKEKIWGGNKLKTFLNKNSESNKFGESWEISSVKNDVSIVANGKLKGKTLTKIIKKYKSELVGKQVYANFGNHFPLLIKYIDAKENLSIQLHPNDQLAQKRHNCFGKTEMWYVMQADKNAELIVGFKKKVTKTQYVNYLEKNNIKSILNTDKVKKGDVYFIETGTVHAIGAGVLLAEIQQTSDITYRIYDWNRKDQNGNFRELHTKNALDAINFKVKKTYQTKYKSVLNESRNVVSCPYFNTNIITINKKIKCDHSKKDSFIIYMCVEGNVIFTTSNKNITLNYGETILIPNSLNRFEIISKNQSKLLEVYIK